MRQQMIQQLITTVFFAGIFTSSLNGAENLCFNGTFDHSDGPLTGWMCDYQWLNNKHYMDNHEKISAQARESTRQHVARMVSTSDAGVKMECKPIPFELGYRYTCKMKIKGGPLRIYFAGYKWKPGVRPHEGPEPGELRTIYKSKAYTEEVSGWKTITLKLPGVEMSPLAIKHLKPVRFITIYVWTTGTLHVDDVEITRVEDRTVGL